MSSRWGNRYAVLGLIAVVAGTIGVAVPAGAGRMCQGERVTITGTRDDDRLRGTPGRDVIDGRSGHDHIIGRGGNDVLCGGRGPDLLRGGGGNDRLDGGPGGDELLGGAGNDIQRGGRGGFTFHLPGPGNDRVVGTPAFDFVGFFEATAGVEANLAEGTAIGEGDDTIIAADGLGGSDFDDVLTGSDGPNFFEGGPGNDEISTGGNAGSFDNPDTAEAADFVAPDFFAPTDSAAPRGDDTVVGGAGIEVMLYDGAAQGVDVNLNSGRAVGEGTDTLTDVQAAIGSQFDDTMTGDNADNAFAPLAGSNTVNGGPGNDVGVYFDSLGPVTADLGAGTASGTFRTFTGDMQESEASGTDSLSQIENVWGSPQADTLTGDGGANELYGMDEDDDLAGAAGNDILDGGNGTDELDGGEGTDQCVNGETVIGCESSPRPTAASPFRWLSFARAWDSYAPGDSLIMKRWASWFWL
ncbi:MAG: calcium-binding protein [Actinomycetota bacterium]